LTANFSTAPMSWRARRTRDALSPSPSNCADPRGCSPPYLVCGKRRPPHGFRRWCWSYLVPAPSGCITPAFFATQSREDQRVLNPMHQLAHHRRPFLERAGWPRACGGSKHRDSDLQSVSSLFAAFAIGKLIARAVCVATAESHLMRDQRSLEGTGGAGLVSIARPPAVGGRYCVEPTASEIANAAPGWPHAGLPSLRQAPRGQGGVMIALAVALVGLSGAVAAIAVGI
jgi:hypothetical protein